MVPTAQKAADRWRSTDCPGGRCFTKYSGRAGCNIWPATGSDSTASSNILKDLERLMGDLFDAMQADLKAAPLVREFYALSSKNQMINTLTPRFVYNATDIPDLVAKVRILENQGFVRDATLADVPIYWMSEGFVSYLTKRGAR
jgi:hypothetical protein